MTTLEVAKRETEYQDTDLCGEQDKAHHGPQDLVDHVLHVWIDVQAGQAHRDGAAEHTEDGTDPYQSVEAQEDGQVCGVEFDAGALEQKAEESEKQQIGHEYEHIPEANAESERGDVTHDGRRRNH